MGYNDYYRKVHIMDKKNITITALVAVIAALAANEVTVWQGNRHYKKILNENHKLVKEVNLLNTVVNHPDTVIPFHVKYAVTLRDLMNTIKTENNTEK
jgi:membrane protein DedA with SNARE-associated domain